MTIIIFSLLALLAALSIGATIVAVLRDGYRRVPTARPLREYDRNEHYRA